MNFLHINFRLFNKQKKIQWAVVWALLTLYIYIENWWTKNNWGGGAVG